MAKDLIGSWVVHQAYKNDQVGNDQHWYRDGAWSICIHLSCLVLLIPGHFLVGPQKEFYHTTDNHLSATGDHGPSTTNSCHTSSHPSFCPTHRCARIFYAPLTGLHPRILSRVLSRLCYGRLSTTKPAQVLIKCVS